MLHGGGDSTSTIPKVSDDFARSLTEQSSPSRTVTVEDGSTRAGGAVPAPDRGTVNVRVLNGTTTSGLAAKTADRLRLIQYVDVSTGNLTGADAGPSIVYYLPGQRPAAEQLGSDLQLTSTPEELPASGRIAAEAKSAPGVDLVLVLRSG